MKLLKILVIGFKAAKCPLNPLSLEYAYQSCKKEEELVTRNLTKVEEWIKVSSKCANIKKTKTHHHPKLCLQINAAYLIHKMKKTAKKEWLSK